MWENFPILYEYKPDHFINLKEIVDIRPSYEPDKFWYQVRQSVHTLTREEHNTVIRILREWSEKV